MIVLIFSTYSSYFMHLSEIAIEPGPTKLHKDKKLHNSSKNDYSTT